MSGAEFSAALANRISKTMPSSKSRIYQSGRGNARIVRDIGPRQISAARSAKSAQMVAQLIGDGISHPRTHDQLIVLICQSAVGRPPQRGSTMSAQATGLGNERTTTRQAPTGRP
jgi:hypothetical protein